MTFNNICLLPHNLLRSGIWHGLTGSFASWTFTRMQSRDSQCQVLTWRFDWGRTYFQVHLCGCGQIKFTKAVELLIPCNVGKNTVFLVTWQLLHQNQQKRVCWLEANYSRGDYLGHTRKEGSYESLGGKVYSKILWNTPKIPFHSTSSLETAIT